MSRPKKADTPSERLQKFEAKQRSKWRQEHVEKRARQVKRENAPRIKWNKEHRTEIDAKILKTKPLATPWSEETAARLEAVTFAPQSRLRRYALDIRRPLEKGERSREFNTRYIDRLTGQFVSKEYAKDLMDDMRAERQTVAIMIAKGIGWQEASEWREHLLDTKDLGYIIRIYGS